MSIVGSEQWMYNPSTGFYPLTIDNSLRFNAGDDPFLSRTPSSAGNRRTWTWSAWVKRGDISNTDRELFGTAAEGDVLKFTDSRLMWFNNGSASSFLSTTAFFRDPGAWYNIVLSFDTTQSTASDRVKLFVNGTAVAFDNNTTFPSLNYEGDINNTEAQFIGKGHGASEFDGYLAEVILLDGTAVSDASNFGELKNDIWVAKNYSGSYGTNGFRLQFKQSGTGTGSSSTVGADTSGNDNHFTSSGITSSDQVIDTPTNSFCTLNRITPAVTHSITEANLQTTNSSGTHGGTTATFNYPTSGKWFHEVRIMAEDSSGGQGVGIGNQIHRTTSTWGNYANLVAYLSNGNKFIETGSTTYTGASAHNAGDIIGVAFDADNQTLEFFHDGTGQGSIPTSEMDGVLDFNNLCPIAFGRNMGQIFNFGQDSTFAGNESAGSNSDTNGNGSFKFAVPSGYAALCTANFPDPAIDPNDDETPDQYFDTILYQAATSDGTYTRGSIAFTPDWSWIKNRDNAERNLWADVIRGNTSMTDKWLVSDSNVAEGTNGVSGTTFSVTSSGYQFVETSIGAGELFFNNRLYVGWNWKAGTSQSFSGESGTLDSTVSSSSEAGFSIVKYTGGSDERVKHGMGTGNIPEMIMVKSLSDTSNWAVYHVGLSANHFLELNSNASQQSGSNPRFQGTGGVSVPTDTYFFVNNYSGSTTNNSSSNYIAYCFHSVDGYSKISTYKGNGSTDGTFVFTGFRPAWLMIKRFDSGSESWNIVDNKRNPLNGAKTLLRADVVNQEVDATNGVDLLSNGFKVRDNIGNYNTSSADYLYMAFADQPFKYSNAR